MNALPSTVHPWDSAFFRGGSENGGDQSHHQPGVVDVPGEGGHGLVLGVHDGILQDVHRVRDIGGEQPLGPARHPVGLGQKSPGEELPIGGHLPVHNVFRQHMLAAGTRAGGEGRGEGLAWPGTRDLRWPPSNP